MLEISNGEDILLGDGLKKELWKFDSEEDEKGDTLVKAYEYAKECNAEAVDKRLKELFENCSSNMATRSLSKFLWRQIWTFNIDDVVEAAYAPEGDNLQRIQSFHYNDAYDSYGNITEVKIIHLHGFARNIDKGVIFSDELYTDVTSEGINVWFSHLATDLKVDPFIIIGSHLNESDLDYYVSKIAKKISPLKQEVPSILVGPRSRTSRENAKKLGFEYFEGTAEEFFSYCSKVLPTPPTPAELHAPALKNLFLDSMTSEEISEFSAAFSLVDVDIAHKSRQSSLDAQSGRLSAFRRGAPPTWNDIKDKKDVPFSNLEQIGSQLIEQTGNNNQVQIKLGSR